VQLVQALGVPAIPAAALFFGSQPGVGSLYAFCLVLVCVLFIRPIAQAVAR
jgi:hypothetical protein